MFSSNGRSVTQKLLQSFRRLPHPSHKWASRLLRLLVSSTGLRESSRMSVELRLLQTPQPDNHSFTSAEMASGVNQHLKSLHRSKPVYQCDVFNHSIAAENSSPFSACLTQSFTEKAAVWLSRETVPSFSQRRFHRCCTSTRVDVPTEKHASLPTGWPYCQPTPPLAMQDLSRSPDRQRYEIENRGHPKCPLPDAEWLDSFSDSHKYGQQQAFTLPESRLVYCGEPCSLEQSMSQGHILDHLPTSFWNLPTQDINGRRLDLQTSPQRLDTQGLSDSHAVLRPSIPISEPCTFPLTPPSSTRGEGASPLGETVGGHQDVVNNAPQADFGTSTSLTTGPSIQNRNSTLPPLSQYLAPEVTWSNEDFAKLFESDLFPPYVEPFDHGSNEQTKLSSGWDYEIPVASPNTGKPYAQNPPGDWHNLSLNQPVYPNVYPSIPPNAFDHANAFSDSTVAMSNYTFDATDQPLQPGASTVMSSLFDGLGPEVDPAAAGRRSGAKAHQRATIKDRELIEWKSQGLSYKEIKARGGFNEAESTLRGRYRTLTKPKHLRVRKPEWQQKDVLSVYHS